MNYDSLCWIVLNLIDFSFIVATLSVLLVSYTPSLHSFLRYGKTLQSNGRINVKKEDWFIYDYMINIHVPKKWFTHFYILHFIFSVFNVYLIFIWSCSFPCSFSDIHLIILENLFQSSRRLFECIYISSFSSTARIHIFHYLVGIFFYTSINIIPLTIYYLNLHNNIGYYNSFIPILSILTFILVSYNQFLCHKVLSIQKKYTLPKNTNIFNYVVCPHYLYESVIYLTQFLLYPSLTYSLVLLWVIVNLSISANQSYIFYKSNDEIGIFQRRIIPYIY